MLIHPSIHPSSTYKLEVRAVEGWPGRWDNYGWVMCLVFRVGHQSLLHASSCWDTNDVSGQWSGCSLCHKSFLALRTQGELGEQADSRQDPDPSVAVSCS